MNQVKIGKFIKEKRKEKKITQDELAEDLGVTNRAISKWENGNCMPDSGIIPDLCKILGITINDLFHGEIIDKKDNDKQMEKYLLEIYRQKELGDKKLLNFEIVFGIISMVFSLLIICIAAYLEDRNFLDGKYVALIVIPTFIYMVVMCVVLLRIEQIAGYYECGKCNCRYVPKFSNVFFAMHMNRTRYMRCPKCNNKSWHKKVLSKGDDYE